MFSILYIIRIDMGWRVFGWKNGGRIGCIRKAFGRVWPGYLSIYSFTENIEIPLLHLVFSVFEHLSL